LRPFLLLISKGGIKHISSVTHNNDLITIKKFVKKIKDIKKSCSIIAMQIARHQISFLQDLNEKQFEAVTLDSGSTLVLAGAGSGKTRVLTSRISWLIHNQIVGPGGLLAVTFTNKAAREMIIRITAQLPINTRGMWIGTFHGLCNRFLRLHHVDANLPETFQILDSQDQLSAIKRLMRSMNVDEDNFPPREVQYHINGYKEEGLRSKAIKPYDNHSKKIIEIYAEYEKQCQKEGVVDFAELLLRCYEVLRENPQLLHHYQERFSHLLIDEFQDTSELQYKWIKLLAGDKNQVFAVGDDDQSIYSFRGARVGNMKDLQKDFKIKDVIKLEQNYRSKNNILNAANAIISNNEDRLGKNLWTDLGHGDPIRQYVAISDLDEANFIIDEVKQLHRSGLNYSQIAILYRSNAQSRVIEHAIVSNNIPYRVYGGLRFFERAEVKHSLAYLRLISNKSDDNALLRIINFPARGIGSKSLEKLQDEAKLKNISLWDAANAGPSNTSNLKKGIPYFVKLIKNIEDEIHGLTIAESIDIINERSGLLQHYHNDKDGLDRISNLQELVSAAVTFADSSEIDNASLNLVEFLNYTSLESGELQASSDQDALQLMTIHSAKGLEFETVFITGLEDGLCPHEQSMSEPNGLEEERRLMYVAVTRAKIKLYLTLSQSRMLHGQMQYNIPSRFLDEIPEELVKALNTAKRQDVLTQPIRNFMPTSNTSYPWKIGTNLNHPKFGNGVVTGYEGEQHDLRIQVKFSSHGIKWLALEYAKLTEI
jgi:DNA helicase-2/ATP-dependent DNA helicase PcrA